MIKKDVSLREYSNFKTGGKASYFLEVSSVEELISEIRKWKKLNLKNLPPPFVLSEGTNVLIDDNGYLGLVIHSKISYLAVDKEIITAGSGEFSSDIVNFSAENSLSGLEWAGGLPGTIGGATRGNAGAFGKETKDNILSVASLNLETFEKKLRNKSECKYGYRDSIFKTQEGRKEMITEVKLSLVKGNKDEIITKIAEKVEYRKKRHPLEYPNLGSTFKNIALDSLSNDLKEEFKGSIKNDPFPIIPVAKILIGTGLKGFTIGGAQFSKKHPNFIINLGNAKSDDAKKLLSLAKEKVKEKYGIDLQEEIMYLG